VTPADEKSGPPAGASRSAARGEPEVDALLEREAELSALEEALAQTRRGAGALVLVEGPAGVGKSRLLEVATERGRSVGLRVQSARGRPLERDFGFGVALQLFERTVCTAAAEERARLLSGAAGLAAPLLCPDAERGSFVSEGPGIVHGLFWLAINLSSPQGLLLVIDDVQWVDRASLRFVAYLLARLEDVPVAVVMALRPGEPGAYTDVLDPFVNGPGSRRVRPQPLSIAAVQRIVRTSGFPAAEEEFCLACSHLTGGNPFLLRALLTEVAHSGIPSDGEGAERLSQLAPEAALRALLARLALLPAGAEALARAVAILGDSSPLRHAAALARLSLDDAARAADALSGAHILRPGDPLGFVHPLVAAVVEADFSVVERARAHGQAARVLAGEGAAPERVSAHLLSAPAEADPWVVETLARAADMALVKGAPAPAARYLARALEEPAPPERRAGLLIQLGRVQISLGMPEAPQTLSEAISVLEDARRRAEVYRLLATAFQGQGRHGDAASALARGLAELGDVEDRLARDLRAGLAAISILDSRSAPGAFAQVTAVVERDAGDETSTERTLLAQLAVQSALSARPREEIRALAERAWGGGRLLAEEGPDGLSWPIVTGALTFVDECEASESICTAVLEEATQRGSVTAFATASYCRSFPRLLRGELLDAIADAEQALAARRYGWQTYVGAATAILALGLAERGDLKAADEALRMVDDDRFAQSLERTLLLEARGRLRWLEGRPADALEDYLAAGRLFEEVFATGTPVVFGWRSGAALASARLGDVDRARALLAEDRSRAEAVGAPGPVGRSLRVAGQVETEPSRAIELLEQAIVVLGDSHARLEETWALVALGMALRRAGQIDRARSVLRRGLEVSQQLGATWLANDARHELASTGLRVRRTALSGPQSLTSREFRVAQMAAAGRSNRDIAQSLFVTVKAVEWHLSHAYRKLGVGSRKELDEALAAR
jgi:DNA-binding NarL/FixJ family response regulator